MNKKTVASILFVTAIQAWACAQSITPQVAASSGDYFTSPAGSVSWTVGEIAGETYSGASYMLTQGFQQPNLHVTALKNKEVTNPVSIYPNPVADKLTFHFGKAISGTYTVEVFDMQGKKIATETHHLQNGLAAQTMFSFENCPSGIYLLNIFAAENNFSQSFRVSKI